MCELNEWAATQNRRTGTRKDNENLCMHSNVPVDIYNNGRVQVGSYVVHV